MSNLMLGLYLFFAGATCASAGTHSNYIYHLLWFTTTLLWSVCRLAEDE